MAIVKKKVTVPLLWLTVYGDFITNLTLFFMLLFGTIMMALNMGLSKEELKEFMQDVSSSIMAGQKTARMTAKAKVTVPAELMGAREGLDGVAEISGIAVTDQELQVTLPEAVLFNPGDARLIDSAPATLRKVAQPLQAVPNTIVVEGHTCDQQFAPRDLSGLKKWELALARSNGAGPYASNRELAAARALQVVKFFVRENLIPAERLSAVSYGAARPLVPNTTPENRVLNRRIEIRMITDGKK
jgi:chemotaxis protein MotB